MALLTCPECSGKVSISASSCPHCGHPRASGHRIVSSQPPPASVILSVRAWAEAHPRATGLLFMALNLPLLYLGVYQPLVEAEAGHKVQVIDKAVVLGVGFSFFGLLMVLLGPHARSLTLKADGKLSAGGWALAGISMFAGFGVRWVVVTRLRELGYAF